MTGVPTDVTLIGTVLAVSLAILALSGIALYIAFRVRDTLKEERGQEARIVKLAFLIGLLFLSGGIFYFFASGFHSPSPTSTATASTLSTDTTSMKTNSTTHATSLATSSTSSSTISSTSSPTTTSSSSTTSSITTSSTTSSSSSTTSSGQTPSLSVLLSYPSSIKNGSTFEFSFTIINNGTAVANSVTIQAGDILNSFTLVSSNYPISGNVIELGNISSGTIIAALQLKAPSKSGQISGTTTLTYQQMSQPIIDSFAIRVN